VLRSMRKRFGVNRLLRGINKIAYEPLTVGPRRIFAVTTGICYLAGGLAGLGAVFLAPLPPERSVPITWIGGGCIVTGLVVLALGRRLRVRAHHYLLAAGTLVITATVYLFGTGIDQTAASVNAMDMAAVYMFIVVGGAFYFPWVPALMHLAFVELCSFAVLQSVGLSESNLVIQQACLVLLCAAVRWLTSSATAAERDALTRLGNRRNFDRRLNEAIAESKRKGRTLSLVLIDFDSFKAINDVQGHAAGDRLLRNVANIWRHMVADDQTLCRQGGDEFVVILPGYSANRAAAFADVLRRAVRETTCSAGVAELRDGDSRSVLVARADVALYEAKNRGGDQTHQYGVGDESGASDAIYQALADGAFDVFYQPIIDLRMGIATGHEALIRWNHPTRGVVSPDEFIPAAEKSGAIHALGRWILHEACSDTAEYIRTTGVTSRVSVNASVQELRHADYASNVEAVLAETGLQPSSLIIEVTESTFDADNPQVIGVLHKLRALGVDVAIDDFGTGYSSLNRLNHLPANVLKIDRSFITNISFGSGDMPILRAIVALAAALKLRIIAEGVETAQQAAVLTQLGCSHAQGYYFGRPCPQQQPIHAA